MNSEKSTEKNIVMLLKDLDIEVKTHGVFISANVIIKRNDKFYSVYNNMAAETSCLGKDYPTPSREFINQALKQFFDHSKAIDKNWKVSELKTGDSMKKILEFEIEL